MCGWHALKINRYSKDNWAETDFGSGLFPSIFLWKDMKMTDKLIEFDSEKVIEAENNHIINNQELQEGEMRKCSDDFEHFCRRWLYIVNKKRSIQHFVN